MNSQSPKSGLKAVGATACFILVVPLLAVGSWLFAHGELPAFPLGHGHYAELGGLTINGSQLPGWTFYFIPGSVCLVAAALCFLGYRLLITRNE